MIEYLKLHYKNSIKATNISGKVKIKAELLETNLNVKNGKSYRMRYQKSI